MSKYGLLAIKDKKIYINEAVELSKKLYEETLEFLTENEDKLINIATELMTKETLEEQELNALIKEE
jgi:ATP-dependent Zn protease